MKRKLALLLAALASVFVLVGPATAAAVSPPKSNLKHAVVETLIDGTQLVNGESVVYPESPWRFNGTNWCVWSALSSQWPLQTAASRWGTVSNDTITSQISFPAPYAGCNGYPRSQEVYVFYDNLPDRAACAINYVDYDESTTYIATANVTINTRPGCATPSQNASTASIYRAHVISIAIGGAAGLEGLNSNVRVMGTTATAYTTVPYPTAADGSQMNCKRSAGC